MAPFKDVVMCKHMYICGGDIASIAACLDVSKKQIKEWIEEYDWELLSKTGRSTRMSFVKTSQTRRLIARYVYEKKLYTYPEVGKLFGVSSEPIQSLAVEDEWKRRNSVEAQDGIFKLKKSEIKQMISLYEEGQTLTEIGRKFDVQRHTVRHQLVRAGVTIRDKVKKFDKKTIAAIIHLYVNENLGVVNIAKTYKCDATVIKRILKDKVKLRGYSEANTLIAYHKVKDYLATHDGSFKEYCHHCRLLTRHVYKQNHLLINPFGLNKKLDACALDHRYSIHAGYYNPKNLENPATIWEVCHPANLRMISSKKNRKKSRNCSISLERLRKEIQEWEDMHINPFGSWQESRVFDAIASKFGEYHDN